MACLIRYDTLDDDEGEPIGSSHDRTAPRVGKRGAACFGATFAVWVPFSPSPSTLS